MGLLDNNKPLGGPLLFEAVGILLQKEEKTKGDIPQQQQNHLQNQQNQSNQQQSEKSSLQPQQLQSLDKQEQNEQLDFVIVKGHAADKENLAKQQQLQVICYIHIESILCIIILYDTF